MRNKQIIRNGAKILSVDANALFLCDLASEYESAAKVFADWPSEDYVGLLDFVNKRGSRLGGATAQFLFRGMGKDSFLLSQDVTSALIREKIVDKKPTSKRDLYAVQVAFNSWRKETDLPLAHISKILACTVESQPNPNHQPL